jgi:hypothetical protein
VEQQQPISGVHDEDAMQDLLYDLLDEQAHDEPDLRVTTFESAGVLTRNRGLVVTMPGGAKFQVTIVQSRGAHEDGRWW